VDFSENKTSVIPNRSVIKGLLSSVVLHLRASLMSSGTSAPPFVRWVVDYFQSI